MKRKPNCLATILFLIYLALLVWIILFKLQFSISDLDKVRSINLIPFHYGSPSGPGHHGCPAYYHHCGCGEPDYIFSAGLQPAEDLGRMFRAGILFLYRIPAFCFWMVSGHLVPGYLVLCPILAPQFVNPQNPLLTMGNRFYYNKGKL